MKNLLLRILMILGGVVLARVVPESATWTNWEVYAMGMYLAVLLDMDVSNYGKPTRPHQE